MGRHSRPEGQYVVPARLLGEYEVPDFVDTTVFAAVPRGSDNEATDVLPVLRPVGPVADTVPIQVVSVPKVTRRVVAIVPAWNEGDEITDTVRALQAQSHQLDEIVVVPNNCTDDTVEQASSVPGVTVWDMGYSKYRKAGAINYALERLLPGMDDEDMVLVQDGDTTLNDGFVAAAYAAMGSGVGGVCARYDNPKPTNLLEQLQSSEFTRSRRKITRDRGRVQILVGIATVFRVGVLRHVLAAREAGELPGSHTYYNLTSLCEDYELTIALRTLGYRLVSPDGCRPLTQSMPSVAKLRGQRERWTRGALDDLQVYGWTKVTRRYIMSQVNRLMGMLAPFLFVAYLLSLQLTFGRIVWDLPWVSINALFIGERVVTVRKGGWRGMLLAALVFPELAYDWLNAFFYLRGLAQHLRGTNLYEAWKET